MKKILIILVIIVLAATVVSILRDQIIKSALSALLTNVTGTKVTIGRLSLSIINHKITIKDFKIYNPKDFPEGVLLDLKKVSVDYDLGELIKKKLYFKHIAVDLREVVVITDKEGKLNVDSLKISKKEKSAPKSQTEQKAEMQIDILTLTLGRVIYVDFSRAAKPSIEAFNIGIKDRVYKNIASAEQLLTLILVESLKSTTIKSAQIYGAASLAGVAMLPASLGYLLTRKDDASENFKAGFERVYLAAKDALNFLGALTHENKAAGKLSGKIGFADIAVKVEDSGLITTKVTVSARKLLLPEPRIAGGLLYQISQNLKNH